MFFSVISCGCHNNVLFLFLFFSSSSSPPGPRLYKEPSAKSNKHIIQNALSHCCMAGKVNEGPKNKILEVRAWGFFFFFSLLVSLAVEVAAIIIITTHT